MPPSDSIYRAERVRGPHGRQALVDYLERHEPWSSAALAFVFMEGLRPDRVRGWLVRDASNSVVGAVVVYSPCLGRWMAYSALDDAAAGPAVAGVVERCPAAHYSGRTSHLEPVLPHVARLHSARTALFVHSTYPTKMPAAASEGTRMALRTDLDGIVSVFSSFGIGIERTRWQLRSALRRNLRRLPVVVFEQDGAIVAAITINGITRRWLFSDQMVVDPNARGRGLSWRVFARMLDIADAYGLPACGVIYATNPMSMDRFVTYEAGWTYASLFEPRRFRGHARLREQVLRFQALEGTRNPEFRPFEQLPYGAAYDPGSQARGETTHDG